MPEGDQAIVATRSFDVLSSHPPSSGLVDHLELVGKAAFSPGPLLYRLLAIPARLPGVAALTLTTAIVNVAAVIGWWRWRGAGAAKP